VETRQSGKLGDLPNPEEEDGGDAELEGRYHCPSSKGAITEQ